MNPALRTLPAVFWHFFELRNHTTTWRNAAVASRLAEVRNLGQCALLSIVLHLRVRRAESKGTSSRGLKQAACRHVYPDWHRLGNSPGLSLIICGKAWSCRFRAGLRRAPCRLSWRQGPSGAHSALLPAKSLPPAFCAVRAEIFQGVRFFSFVLIDECVLPYFSQAAKFEGVRGSHRCLFCISVMPSGQKSQI